MNTNTVTISGRIGQDPVLRFTAGGSAVCNLRLLRNDRVKQGDQWVDGPIQGFDITCWRQLAEKAALLPVGTLVDVHGRLKQRTWETNEGERRSTVEIEADAIGADIGWLRDIEGQRGHLALTWGKGEQQQRPPEASNVAEQYAYDEEPF